MKYFLIFGTHPRLSLAEFRAIAPHVPSPILVGHATIVEDPQWDGSRLMDTLGGTVKLGEIVDEYPVGDVSAERLAEMIRISTNADSLDFGFTVFGGTERMQKDLRKMPIALKRALKEQGIRSRWVTSKEGVPLSPAAVAKLKLTEYGTDLVCIIASGTAYIGKTTHVQNADAWSERDYGRPLRDDEAGMLPPKLARIMVNLARVKDGETILDPFCGNGTVLMEGALITKAQHIIGSDIEERQSASSLKNLEWLVEHQILTADDAGRTEIFTADARHVSGHLDPTSVHAVISEGMMGPPLRGHEPQSAIQKNAKEISSLWIQTLDRLRPALANNARLVLVWPSFKTEGGIARVGLDEEVVRLGYRVVNPLGDWDESNGPLIYHRQGQRVARRIVVLAYVG